jgi:hypothetical protein
MLGRLSLERNFHFPHFFAPYWLNIPFYANFPGERNVFWEMWEAWIMRSFASRADILVCQNGLFSWK